MDANNTKIAVLGAGIMGKQLALLFASRGFLVFLWNRVDKERIEKELARLARLESKRKNIEKNEIDNTLRKITVVDNLNMIAGCSILIEAVKEDLSVKKEVLKNALNHYNDYEIIATNTSMLSISELSPNNMKERFIGLHFFNPPMSMKLVEVIKGEWTTDDTVEKATSFLEKIEKKAAVIPESPGFIVNRILFSMINEAMFTVSEGIATPATIDKCLKLGANHPMGPLELADYIGLDVCLAILSTMYEETGDPKYRPAPILKKYTRAGKLGRKSGYGFYSYRKSG